MADISHSVDKAYEGKEFAELADAPIDALEGISKAGAEAIAKHLGVKTIRELAHDRRILWAQAITALAPKK